MKKSNRILSFLLALVMMVSLLPGNVAFAEDAGKVGRAAEGVGPYTGEVEDAGEAPEVPEDGGIIAPVTEPGPTLEEPEEPGDPDEPGEPEDPQEPVGDDAPGGPPVISPETGEDKEDHEAGEIQALPPENGAEPMSVVVLASTLAENSDLVLTGHTELQMDEAKVLNILFGNE